MAEQPRTKTFRQCMKLMQRRDPELMELGFWALEPRAHEFVEELLAEFEAHRDTNHGLSCWLLELLGVSKDERALELFVSLLGHESESYRSWAARGLRALGTKKARRALFEAGLPRV